MENILDHKGTARLISSVFASKVSLGQLAEGPCLFIRQGWALQRGETGDADRNMSWEP